MNFQGSSCARLDSRAAKFSKLFKTYWSLKKRWFLKNWLAAQRALPSKSCPMMTIIMKLQLMLMINYQRFHCLRWVIRQMVFSCSSNHRANDLVKQFRETTDIECPTFSRSEIKAFRGLTQTFQTGCSALVLLAQYFFAVYLNHKNKAICAGEPFQIGQKKLESCIYWTQSATTKQRKSSEKTEKRPL